MSTVSWSGITSTPGTVTSPSESTTVCPFCPADVDHFTEAPGASLKSCVLRGVTSVVAAFFTVLLVSEADHDVAVSAMTFHRQPQLTQPVGDPSIGFPLPYLSSKEKFVKAG